MRSFLHSSLALIIVCLGLLCTTLGLLSNFLFIFLVVSSIWSALALLLRIANNSFLVLDFKDPEKRLLVFQWISHSLMRISAAILFLLCLVPRQFESSELTTIYYILVSSTLAPIIAEFFPSPNKRPYRLGIHTAVLFFLIVEMAFLIRPGKAQDIVFIHPPFKKDFFVLQGGPAIHTNHHYKVNSQRHALDLMPLPYSRSSTKPTTQHSCFSIPIIAPVSGVVRSLESTHSDIGGFNPKSPAGNHVVIEWQDKFVMLAHLKQNSVLPKIGDEVRQGEEIAQCGNSGNSTEAHLHLQVQTKLDFLEEGSHTFPIRFDGWEQIHGGFSPSKQSQWTRRNDEFTKQDR